MVDPALQYSSCVKFLWGVGRGIVADGFEALAGMPQWYQIALGAIVSASFATICF